MSDVPDDPGVPDLASASSSDSENETDDEFKRRKLHTTSVGDKIHVPNERPTPNESPITCSTSDSSSENENEDNDEDEDDNGQRDVEAVEENKDNNCEDRLEGVGEINVGHESTEKRIQTVKGKDVNHAAVEQKNDKKNEVSPLGEKISISPSRAKAKTFDEKLKSCLLQASTAFLKQNYLSSVSEYKIALKMLTDNKKGDQNQMYIILYCLGLSHINLTLIKDIREGEKVFQRLIDEGIGDSICVLGYLGLAKVYLKQNRFSEAICPLQEGINLINNDIYPQCCNWPGTSIVIQETNDPPVCLKNAFEDLLSECRNPPQPVAVCRYPQCADPIKTQMYLSDPEFKGYVQVICLERCFMEFHRDCWRHIKNSQLDKRSDKELIGASCITPDCESSMCRIIIFGPDGNVLKQLPTEEGPGASKSKKQGLKGKKSVQLGKALLQKKVSGKKLKGGLCEEKLKVTAAEGGCTGADSRSRMGDAGHHRDDVKAMEAGWTDGGKGARMHNRRKSDATEGDGQGHENTDTLAGKGPECMSSADADQLSIMQRTDFVALQRKKPEQESENMSKKAKKKRDKDKTKKTALHLDEFVDKLANEEEEEGYEHMCLDSNEYSTHLWLIPPYRPREVPEGQQNSGWPFSADTESEIGGSRGNLWSYENALSLSGAGDHSNFTTKSVDYDDTLDPQTVSSQSDKGENCLENKEDLKGNIMSFFETFLEKHGPCLPDDDLIQRELEAFPVASQVLISEIGGITKLLLQSLKFTFVDGYICLLRDAAKARQKARQKRLESQGSNVKGFGSVQTLAKTNNTSITLSESAFHRSDENISSTNTVDPNIWKNDFVPASTASITSGSSTTNGKSSDSLSGLCDLNDYKEMLRQKRLFPPPATAKSDPVVDDESNLSVIEKFKKQVHLAASKEKNKNMMASMTASSTDSVNETSGYYSKTTAMGKNICISDSSVYNASLLTNPCDDLSFNDKRNGTGGDFERMDLSLQDDLDVLDTISTVLDNDYETAENNSVRKITTSLLPTSHNIDVAYRAYDNLAEASPGIHSTLSATASEFYFPSDAKNIQQHNPMISTMAGQNSCNTVFTLKPGSSSLEHDLVTLSSGNKGQGFAVKQVPSLSHKVLAGAGNHVSRGDRMQDKATITDEGVTKFHDYCRLKKDYDHFRKKYAALAEKQLQMQSKHMEELQILRDKLKSSVIQQEIAEEKSQQLEKESAQWKLEKKSYEEDLEKLRSELSYTKTSLESANHLVEVTDRLLTETQNVLKLEQDERRNVHDKYESLLHHMEIAVRGSSEKTESLLGHLDRSANSLALAVDSPRSGKKTKQSFDKIVNALSLKFPNLTRLEMTRCIQEVRLLRNNSLSGLTVNEIVSSVRDFILQEQGDVHLKKNVVDLPNSIQFKHKRSSNHNSTSGEDAFQDEVDPCIICHEELSAEAACMLDCGHSFHTECVRKWFREQSTCPTCRNHALLQDDFPSLTRTINH